MCFVNGTADRKRTSARYRWNSGTPDLRNILLYLSFEINAEICFIFEGWAFRIGVISRTGNGGVVTDLGAELGIWWAGLRIWGRGLEVEDFLLCHSLS